MGALMASIPTNPPSELEAKRLQDACWLAFKSRFESIPSYSRALKLVENELPPTDNPSRSYFENMRVFLESFRVPGGASRKELVLYLSMLERITFPMTPDFAETTKKALRAGITERIDIRESGSYAAYWKAP
jgi:hypothetical protein